jgi:hypothetical protein
MRRTGLICLIATLVIAVLGCTGTTRVHRQHHLWSDEQAAISIYLLRPEHRFMGVTGRPVSVDLEGEEIADLARGQYTLVRLVPGTYEMIVGNWTVVGPDNAMVRAKTPYEVGLTGPDPAYLVFVPEDRSLWESFLATAGWAEFPVFPGLSISVEYLRPPRGFIVEAVDSETALAIAADLEPIGEAREAPLVP